MGLFGRKSQPKFDTPAEYLEDEDVVLANEYDDSLFTALRCGDVNGRVTNKHFRNEALERARDKGLFVVFNERTGLWETRS